MAVVLDLASYRNETPTRWLVEHRNQTHLFNIFEVEAFTHEEAVQLASANVIPGCGVDVVVSYIDPVNKVELSARSSTWKTSQKKKR